MYVCRNWNCCLEAILTDYASSAFHRWESLAGGTEKGPLRLYCGGVPDHPSSGENQGELRTNQPQLTPSSGLRTKKEISCAQIRRRQPGCNGPRSVTAQLRLISPNKNKTAQQSLAKKLRFLPKSSKMVTSVRARA
jgi:hypothetical protein